MLSEVITFFVYDSLKIILLLFFMIALIGFLRSYISQKTLRRKLSAQRYGMGNITGAMLGAITPFCSCSSIPFFLSFIRAGVPVGIALSFLITSPIVNEYLVVIMLALFGWKITLAYVLIGLAIGALSGIILGKMHVERYLVKDIRTVSSVKEAVFARFSDRVRYGFREAMDITKKLWYWILLGVGVGALIHNVVPDTLVQQVMEATGVFSVPIAVVMGVPLYGNCAAIVPVALALFQKGVPLGTALAFMMAMSALSFPEAIILRRAMSLRLILLFFGIVTLGIIVSGYLLNVLQGVL